MKHTFWMLSIHEPKGTSYLIGDEKAYKRYLRYFGVFRSRVVEVVE